MSGNSAPQLRQRREDAGDGGMAVGASSRDVM
jgi:hypothetical protein